MYEKAIRKKIAVIEHRSRPEEGGDRNTCGFSARTTIPTNIHPEKRAQDCGCDQCGDQQHERISQSWSKDRPDWPALEDRIAELEGEKIAEIQQVLLPERLVKPVERKYGVGLVWAEISGGDQRFERASWQHSEHHEDHRHRDQRQYGSDGEPFSEKASEAAHKTTPALGVGFGKRGCAS